MASLRRWTLLLSLSLLLTACGKPAKPTTTLPPVTVSRPSREMVADRIELTGTVSPSRSVDLVARVVGYLESVNFKDGSVVDNGQLLFLIEPTSYEEQLALAKAALQRAEAEYARQVGLLKENATSAANVEKWLSDRDQARAQVELAKLNLSYTRVTAPFTGRIGRRLVDPGNLVSPSANTKLATLEQLTPIYVYFSLNERDALRLYEKARQRRPEGPPRTGATPLPVFVGLQNQADYPYEGVLDFVDTGLSPSSGTVQLRATFKNENHALFPGLFARVRLPLDEPKPMLVVPQSALGNDQEGDYALVVTPDNTVARRTIIKGPLTKSGCAIESGLSPEDRVIIKGILNAKPGAKVRPETATEPPS